MSYATIQDVQARDPTLQITASSVPNASQVSRFIEDTAAELDGILAALDYSVPIATTATQAHAMLRGFNALGANAYVQEATPTSRDRDLARKLWEDCKKALAAGNVALPGAAAGSGGLALAPGVAGAAGSVREPWFAATYADRL